VIWVGGLDNDPWIGGSRSGRAACTIGEDLTTETLRIEAGGEGSATPPTRKSAAELTAPKNRGAVGRMGLALPESDLRASESGSKLAWQCKNSL
jgi:hypothetical protein